MDSNERTNDLVLAFNEYAYVLDTQSGNIAVMVGPLKKALERTDQPILFGDDPQSYKYVPMRQAIKKFVFADEGSYVILENPTVEGEHPKSGIVNKVADLQYGKAVVVKGPVTFPLFPGQTAEVIEGHQLKSNQYVLQREVIDGKLSIIKGTDKSFFIPETGYEVVADKDGKYVRNAVSIERMQYCVLLDENGEKRYEIGPQVVFPKPTERFITQNGSPVYNAIELNENMGLYVKVTADYGDGKKESHKAGDELFITGKEQKIYYPRPEHALIKYGDQVIHYAVAVPKGEGRYVLNKETGDVTLVKGPRMYLPDPRKEVIVRRALSAREVSVMFPGNEEALEVNAELMASAGDGEYPGVPSVEAMTLDGNLESNVRKAWTAGAGTRAKRSRRTKEVTDKLFSNVDRSSGSADYMKRNTSYTSPRTINLDTKYDGAVGVNVWPGFAIQVVNKLGERRVVVGPASVLLEYDETLEILELSTGTPKTSHPTMPTSYLCVENNRVSDVVHGVTKDYVNVTLDVAYRVNFEGDKSKWFNVSNYVKLLTEHCRSMLRVAIKQYGIEELNANYVDIMRDSILGEKVVDGERAGRSFHENNMRVYDMEVFSLKIQDQQVSNLLQKAQVDTMSSTIQATLDEMHAKIVARQEVAKRAQLEEKAETAKRTQELDDEVQGKKRASDMMMEEHEKALALSMAERSAIEREVKSADQALAENHAKTMTDIDVGAFKDKAGAIQPKLIEALITSGNISLAEALAENLPASTGEFGRAMGFGGIGQLMKLVEGTGMENALRQLQKSDNDG